MVRPPTAQINLLSGEEPERRDKKKKTYYFRGRRRLALEEVASSAASAMDWQLGGALPATMAQMPLQQHHAGREAHKLAALHSPAPASPSGHHQIK